MIFPFFITVVGSSFVVINKVGPQGLIAIVVILLIIPTAHLISKANGRVLKELVTQKDKRINQST